MNGCSFSTGSYTSISAPHPISPTYIRLANAPPLSQIALQQNGTTRMTTN
jgi:hypothetical protein